MLNRNSKLSLLILIPFITSCASITAPREYVPPLKEKELKKYRYGAYVELEVKGKGTLSGEFIGISGDTVFVFVRRENKIYYTPLSNVKNFVIIPYYIDWKTSDLVLIGVWTALGIASTLTHGLLLILTAPAWVLSGTAGCAIYTYNRNTRSNIIMVKNINERVISFSRYPQGVPEEIKREAVLF